MNREEQVSRNLALAGGYLEHLLEHPAELADVPDGANLVLIPDDDPELADANTALARALVGQRRRPEHDEARDDVTLTPASTPS